jgi:hypothetical protein
LSLAIVLPLQYPFRNDLAVIQEPLQKSKILMLHAIQWSREEATSQ